MINCIVLGSIGSVFFIITENDQHKIACIAITIFENLNILSSSCGSTLQLRGKQLDSFRQMEQKNYHPPNSNFCGIHPATMKAAKNRQSLVYSHNDISAVRSTQSVPSN